MAQQDRARHVACPLCPRGMSSLRRRTARSDGGRSALSLAGNASMLPALSHEKGMRGLKTSSSSPYLCTSIYLPSMQSRHSTDSFGCPAVPHCTGLSPACSTCVAASLAWPGLPLDRRTGCSDRARDNGLIYVEVIIA
jgi:hypothetical protein